MFPKRTQAFCLGWRIAALQAAVVRSPISGHAQTAPVLTAGLLAAAETAERGVER